MQGRLSRSRIKLDEHVPLAEARRKIWQKVDQLIADFSTAKTRCSAGNNPSAKAKLSEIRARIRELIHPNAELSAVARWCILVRNDSQLSKLIG